MQDMNTPVLGHITGAPLGSVDCLLSPWARDPFCRLRPALNAQALRLSAELCDMTYFLTIDPWMQAGWTDVSIQIDNTLQSGLTASVQGEQMMGFVSSWKRLRAKSALKEYNPISQVMGALRQRESSDTVKAVTMIKKAQNGRYIVSIGFMGTGGRFYDWISNLRFSPEEGFHKGFYQLTTYFEQSADRILFPDTAQELGLEGLTLRDVIEELKSPNSRFFLWMAGHSQGGAVMQIYTHMLIHQMGVLPQNLMGYGFASPTVATGKLVYDPASYPLYHLINTDDYVPRVGALCHLGMGLSYQANDAMRKAAYGLSDSAELLAPREDMRRLFMRAVDTPTMMEQIMALLKALMTCKAEETLESLSDKRWSIAPIDKLLTAAGNMAQEGLEKLTLYVQQTYEELTGRTMDEHLLTALTLQSIDVISKYQVKQIVRAMSELVLPAHSINREHGKIMGAYAFIAQRGLTALSPFIWVSTQSTLPVRQYADEAVWKETPSISVPPVTLRKTIRIIHPKPLGTRVTGISTLRAANRRGQAAPQRRSLKRASDQTA